MKYSALVGQQPICWRLLKGCRKRLIQLRVSINRWRTEEIKTFVKEFNSLREDILLNIRNNTLLPKMSKGMINRCKPLKFEYFDELSKLQNKRKSD